MMYRLILTLSIPGWLLIGLYMGIQAAKWIN